MAKLILFSGGCNSGKTTTLRAVADKLVAMDYDVKILDELIRKETNMPIDELRKNANAYLDLQNKIIRKKIELEKAAIEDSSNDIYLADRAATDSMFYLENYVDKNQLDDEHIAIFCELHKSLDEYLKRYFWRYHLLIQFAPLEVKVQDKFRPKRVDILKDYESHCIERLNFTYYLKISTAMKKVKIMNVDLNYSIWKESVVNRIIDLI